MRAALGRRYGDISEAGFAQRNYLITGRPEQLDQYRHLASKIAAQTESIGSLVSDNPRQTENLAPLQPLIDRTRALLVKREAAAARFQRYMHGLHAADHAGRRLHFCGPVPRNSSRKSGAAAGRRSQSRQERLPGHHEP
ncbi:CHASE3 domain-containing protein [Polaromonas sp. JS666]|uniref:CHASE3 domain-containing protein n=1 Tax=Polaromonas sp. (strain JS666 / ATCC BAA-500) TaxID=296591 RepID=UPI0035102F4E